MAHQHHRNLIVEPRPTLCGDAFFVYLGGYLFNPIGDDPRRRFEIERTQLHVKPIQCRALDR